MKALEVSIVPGYFGTVTVPAFDFPLGPVAVPLAVVVVPLLVVVPLAVLVPPFGPVTVAESDVPVRVFVALAEPDTAFPFAPVAVPLAVAVVPFCFTDPVAVLPRLPVTVFCASAEEAGSITRKRASAVAMDRFLEAFFTFTAILQWCIVEFI